MKCDSIINIKSRTPWMLPIENHITENDSPSVVSYMNCPTQQLKLNSTSKNSTNSKSALWN